MSLSHPASGCGFEWARGSGEHDAGGGILGSFPGEKATDGIGRPDMGGRRCDEMSEVWFSKF